MAPKTEAAAPALRWDFSWKTVGRAFGPGGTMLAEICQSNGAWYWGKARFSSKDAAIQYIESAVKR